MKQPADKIYNIEHAENVHIESASLRKTAEKLNQVIDRIPGLIETTIVQVLSQKSSEDRTVCDYLWNIPIDMSPSKGDNFYGVGDIVLSHWRLDRRIGEGSYSTVYEAHHTEQSNIYKSAIKIIHSTAYFSHVVENNDVTHIIDVSYMMSQELKNMVELKGTGYIVEYEDHERAFNSDGSQDIILRMELMQPLSHVLKTRRLTNAEIIRLGIDICKALEFCNKINVIHCDVKPSNIYLSKWGGYKLGDFSASANIEDHQELKQIGTLKYMAPEIYAGRPFSSNIDTYSLGLVLYELLNGIQENMLQRRLSGEPLSPIPGISKSLQSIIFKACAYNPDERFASPTEMLNALTKESQT